MLTSFLYLAILSTFVSANPFQPTVTWVATPRQIVKLDLNRATTADLERLPGIGPVLAFRIVEHRRRYGSFKRPQDVIIVRGMSARRYRAIAHLIRI